MANPQRGEANLTLNNISYRLRPSFAALVAAEEEVGPLFALVDRAAGGTLKLSEMAALFWHCLVDRPEALSRTVFSHDLAGHGLANATPTLKILLSQILLGQISSGN